MSQKLPAWLPSLGTIFFMVLIIGAYLKGPEMLNIDGDLGRHLTIGSYILDAHRIPTRDIFSHTMPGKALTPHEWLSQVLFALAYRLLDLSGPVFLSALCITFALWLTFRAALLKSGSLFSALLCGILGMAASSLHWLTRPHIFTFLMLAIWLAVLEGVRKGTTLKIRPWLLTGFLMLVWANLHGAFIAGFAVWLIYGASYIWDRWVERSTENYAPHFGRQFIFCGAASALATLINPDGLGLWRTSLGYLGNEYLVGHTEEYLSPNFHQPAFWPFLILLILGIVLLGWSGKRRSTVDVALMAAWGAMSLVSARNIPLFVLVSVPLISETLKDVYCLVSKKKGYLHKFGEVDRRFAQHENSIRLVWWLPGIVLVMVALAAFGLGKDANRFNPEKFPVAAVDWLEANPQPGRVFNYFPWGGYLLFRGWPELAVFIDGQTDFYGEELTKKYENVISAQPGWQVILDEYQVRWALLPVQSELEERMISSGDWGEVYRDGTAVILSVK